MCYRLTITLIAYDMTTKINIMIMLKDARVDIFVSNDLKDEADDRR